MTNACPDLIALEDASNASTGTHLVDCSSCRLVVELLEERRRGLAERDVQRECARFEMLIAAREEGTIGGTAGELLAAHLRECSDCAAVAATLVPGGDRSAQLSLPAVSTASYALGREVARGGMGRILEARDLRIGRPVAVKELLGKAPALAARFEREARVTARLQHPGIVPIYEIGTWPDGTPFYAMRMVEGQTLREALRTRKTLDERLALLPAMIAASEAVAFAHGKRIIHRDLTPNNILVGAHGDTVVIDWGLAKDLNDASEDIAVDPYRDLRAAGGMLTNVGAVIGTAAYMPPEQARGESVDERADVYALGAILYQLLAGVAPYGVEASDEVVKRVQSGPPISIAEVARGAPRDLVSIVDKAMARDASARYENATALVDDLRRLQAGRIVEAHHYSTLERVRRWIRAHRGVAIGTMTALVAMLVTGTVAVVGIVTQRDRAEAGERDALQQRAAADRTNAELLEAQGRDALEFGDPVRASIWLSASYSAGNSRPSLLYLLGTAMRDVESPERRLDCGAEPTSLDLSPDKTMVVAACGTSLRMWRIADGALVRKMFAPGARFGGARFSHDGRRIISRGPDGVARVWNTSTGELELSLVGHTGKLATAMFSADDAQILTSGADRTARIWDAHSGALVRSIAAAEPPIGGVIAGLVGDDRIVSLSADGRVKVWNRASGALIRTIVPGGQLIGGDIEPAAGGRRIIVCGVEGVASIWDIDTGMLVRSLSGHSEVMPTCKFSPDQRFIVTTSNDHTAKVWNAETGRLIQTMTHEGAVKSASFSPDQQSLITIETSGLRVWDIATGMLLGADETADSIDDDLKVVGDRIIAAHGKNVVIWRGLGRSRHAFHAPHGATIEAANPDGTRAVVVDHDAVMIWNVEARTPIDHATLRLPISQTGDYLAASAGDGVTVVDMRSGATVVHIAVAHPQNLELGADAHFLLVRRDSEPSDTWDLRTGKMVKAWAATELPIGIATGGNRVVVWNMKKQAPAEVWDLEQLRVVQRIQVDVAQFVWFASNAQRLILHRDGMGPLSIYDLSNGREVRTMPGVIAGGVSTDGSTMVVARFGKLTVVRCVDGATISELAWGMILGVMGVTNDGRFIAGSESIKSTIEMIDPNVGALAAMPYKNIYEIGDGTLQVGGLQAHFAPDEKHLVLFGKNDLVRLDLTPESRTPEVVAKIVGERTPFRVEHARLVPKEVPGGFATLAGRIVHDGTPVVGADVVVIGPDGGSLAAAHSSQGGEFSFVGLPAGPVKLSVASVGVGAFARPVPAVLSAGTNRIDVDLDLAGSIAGQVVDATGHPIANARIHVDCSGCEDQDSGDDTTHDDGTFTIRALMGGGTYVVKVTGEHDAVLEPMPEQAPILVKNGKDHVTGVRFIVKPVP